MVEFLHTFGHFRLNIIGKFYIQNIKLLKSFGKKRLCNLEYFLEQNNNSSSLKYAMKYF